MFAEPNGWIDHIIKVSFDVDEYHKVLLSLLSKICDGNANLILILIIVRDW